MTYEEDSEDWENVQDAINELRDRDEKPWSDSKVAKWLREEARGFEPYRPKRRKINVWKISNEDLSKESPETQKKVKEMRERDLKLLE